MKDYDHCFYLDKPNREFIGVKTNHEWRKRKRREIRAVIKAAEVYLLGSAYTPFSALTPPDNKMSLLDLLRDMKQRLSVKHWGR